MTTDRDIERRRAASDSTFKYFVHKRYVLSRLLKDNLDELKDMSLDEIDKCLDLGEDGDTVIGRETEYVSADEQKVILDSVFDIRVPGSGKEISVIVGVEGQNDPNPGYPLGKRAEYYLARMVSAQKGREFDGTNYSNLRKTYSIWCILDPRTSDKNTVVRYRMVPERTFGTGDREPETLDTFNVIMVNIGQYREGLPDALAIGSAMFSVMDNVQRRQLISERFNISINDEDLERLKDMNDVFQDKFDHGLRVGEARGIEIGEARGEARGIEIGKDMGRIETYIANAVSLIQKKGMSIDEVLSVLDVPDDLRPEVISEVHKKLMS